MARPRRVHDTAETADTEAPSLPTQRAIELMRRWLDLKKATSMGNVHNVAVLIYDLMAITADNGEWLYSSSDVKEILNLFGFAADFVVDRAESDRDQVTKFMG